VKRAQLAARLTAVGDAVETPLVASPKAATP
jgi:hypothetical protein